MALPILLRTALLRLPKSSLFKATVTTIGTMAAFEWIQDVTDGFVDPEAGMDLVYQAVSYLYDQAEGVLGTKDDMPTGQVAQAARDAIKKLEDNGYYTMSTKVVEFTPDEDWPVLAALKRSIPKREAVLSTPQIVNFSDAEGTVITADFPTEDAVALDFDEADWAAANASLERAIQEIQATAASAGENGMESETPKGTLVVSGPKGILQLAWYKGGGISSNLKYANVLILGMEVKLWLVILVLGFIFRKQLKKQWKSLKKDLFGKR